MLQIELEITLLIFCFTVHIISLLIKQTAWNETLSVQYNLYCSWDICILTDAKLGHVNGRAKNRSSSPTAHILVQAVRYIQVLCGMYIYTCVRAHLTIVKHTSSFIAVAPVGLAVSGSVRRALYSAPSTSSYISPLWCHLDTSQLCSAVRCFTIIR